MTTYSHVPHLPKLDCDDIQLVDRKSTN